MINGENRELSRYWTLIQLTPSGGYQVNQIPQARAYLQHSSLDLQVEAKHDRALQIYLTQQFQAGDLEAGLCLRCYISHGILQECQALVRQFGSYYGLDETELLSYVLNDEGAIAIGRFKPLGYEILEKYNSEVAALNTWTARLVRQNIDLKQCLKEHGLLLITDWGLLNDTKPQQLRRILIEYFDEAEIPTNQAVWVHEAYRFVYLPDRPSKKGGTCTDPTPEQLQRMADYVQKEFGQTLAPEGVMATLQWSAKHLRQYRLKDPPPPPPSPPSLLDGKIEDFLANYRQQFSQCLDQSIGTVVEARTQGTSRPLRATTAEKFLAALRLYYCEGISQGRIAEQLEMRGQDAVAKLLKLTQLRSEIKLHMLTCLQNYIQAVADAGDDPDKLLAIDAALNQQLDDLIQRDQEWGYTVTAYLSQEGGLLSQRICAYLNYRSRRQ